MVNLLVTSPVKLLWPGEQAPAFARFLVKNPIGRAEKPIPGQEIVN